MQTADLRQFAEEIVRRLRAGGFEALWAGGCVRDQFMGREPKDYDVVTNARPEQVRALLPDLVTIPVGAVFGVIAVVGGPGRGTIEVATFRADASYSDGRHPDYVEFRSALEDAQRRDFTINGLFFDPLTHEALDYVDGLQDLRARVVRAIGDPGQRFAEDKLRMLRAIRFATILDFDIAPETFAAIHRHAAEIRVVSAERIGQELRYTLLHPRRRRGMELLAASGLLGQLVPELELMLSEPACGRWLETLQILAALERPVFGEVLAAWLRPLVCVEQENQLELAVSICERLKLTRDEIETMQVCLGQERMIRQAQTMPWPTLQRLLISPRIEPLLNYAQAVAHVLRDGEQAVAWCRQRRSLPAAEWNPPPLLTGNDLKQLGLPQGPLYRQILTQVRDAQLLGQLCDRDEALAAARQLWHKA